MLHLFESITEDTVTVLVIFFCFTSESGSSSLSDNTINLEMVFLFQETTVKLKTFSEHLTSYICFLRKILPYQLKRYLFNPSRPRSLGNVGCHLTCIGVNKIVTCTSCDLPDLSVPQITWTSVKEENHGLSSIKF